MIELINISKSYNKGEIKAVDNLNLTVNNGEIFGFLGPNGAGKSTTIKMIVGLLNPDEGIVKVNGVDNQKNSLKCKQQIAYVPENAETYERLKGIEYLNFIGNIYNTPMIKRKEITQKWAEIFGLESVLNNFIKSYSHGMRQKIILMGALIADTQVLILDEPLIGLDPKSAHSLKEIMKEYCEQNKTLFFSTHVMEVAEKICDRIAIINEGKLVECGTMTELRDKAKDSSSLENIFLEITEK